MSPPPAHPLRGTIVIDASRLLPGAVVSRMLLDLGARVIKIEEPGTGDPLRWTPPLVGGVGAVFCAFYRGAESVCIDLKEPDGAAALRELSRKAHVLLENFRPGTLERWGIGPEQLLSIQPGLVICSLSGFGYQSPDTAVVAHDINLVAWSGLLSLLPGDGVPGTQIADVAAGLMACSAVLAALLGRERSGSGGWIDQPLSSGPLPFLTLPLAEAAGGGGGFVGDHFCGACPSYRLYTCGDGARIALGAVEPKFWIEFVRVLGLPELAERGRDRGAAGESVAEQVQRKLQARPRDQWLAQFEQLGLPVSAVRETKEALDGLRRAGWIEETPVPGGTLPLPAPYLRSLGVTPAQPAPQLGSHTASIFEEFGLAGSRG